MSFLGPSADDLGDDDDADDEHKTWLLTPVVCVVVLTAGVVAGVVRALRADGSERCVGVPLPRCSCLTARWSVRIAAWGALIAGLFGIITASRRFVVGWRKEVPPYLLGVTLASYFLLALAPLLTLLGLRGSARGRMEGHAAYRQAARAALMGGLAAGLATEVLCNEFEYEHFVPREWSQGCGMLGASSGFLLLGLYAAQADGQWGSVDSSSGSAGRGQASSSDEARGGDGFGSRPARRSGNFFSERWRADTEDHTARDGLVTRQDSEDSRLDVLGPDATSRSILGGFFARPTWPSWTHGAQARDPSSGDLQPHFSGRLDQTSSLDEPLLGSDDSGSLLAGLDAPLPASAAAPDALAVPASRSLPLLHAASGAAAGVASGADAALAEAAPGEVDLPGGLCPPARGASHGCGSAEHANTPPGGPGSPTARASSPARGSCGTLGPGSSPFPREPALLPVLAS